PLSCERVTHSAFALGGSLIGMLSPTPVAARSKRMSPSHCCCRTITLARLPPVSLGRTSYFTPGLGGVSLAMLSVSFCVFTHLVGSHESYSCRGVLRGFAAVYRPVAAAAGAVTAGLNG